MQLWKRLITDVANHVHGLLREEVEPGLSQSQEVFCLLFWLQQEDTHSKMTVSSEGWILMMLEMRLYMPVE